MCLFRPDEQVFGDALPEDAVAIALPVVGDHDDAHDCDEGHDSVDGQDCDDCQDWDDERGREDARDDGDGHKADEAHEEGAAIVVVPQA